MKILMSSHLFPPSVGGIERVGWLLARGFAELGHEVRVVTQTPAGGQGNCGVAPLARKIRTPLEPLTACSRRREEAEEGQETLDPPPDVGGGHGDNWSAEPPRLSLVARAPEVVRRPSWTELVRAVRWCDLYLHNNISLQTAWPLLFARRPWVLVHHTWIARVNGTLGWRDHLKRLAARWGFSITVSTAMGRALPVSSIVLPNPYDDELFQELPGVERDQELIFVGRLVSDKGADVLIEALAKLRQQNLTPRLTLVGDGPAAARLKALAYERGVKPQITFAGAKTGLELVELLNRHRIMVVPSRWQEPFGLVALEGIACGCVVVGSSGGGLPEAIGPCGVTFPNGNSERLAEALGDLLRNPAALDGYRAPARAHLRPHQRKHVAQAYLTVFQNLLQLKRHNPFAIPPRQQTVPVKRAA